MIDKFNREKFMFEFFWMLTTGLVAFYKFQDIYNQKGEVLDYPTIFYTAIVFATPILANARFCTNIFLLKNERKEFKNIKHKKAVEKGYGILNGLFWCSIFLNIILQFLVFVVLINGKRYYLIFLLMVVNYISTLFVGSLAKILTYFESKEVVK